MFRIDRNPLAVGAPSTPTRTSHLPPCSGTPLSYTRCSGDENSLQISRTQPKPGEIIEVIWDFEGRSRDELTLRRGDNVELIERDDEFEDGWYNGRNVTTREIGLFPAAYTGPRSLPQLPATGSSPIVEPSVSSVCHRPLPQLPSIDSSPISPHGIWGNNDDMQEHEYLLHEYLQRMRELGADDEVSSVTKCSEESVAFADESLEEITRSCGWTAEHKEYDNTRPNLLVVLNNLGHGSLGVVDEVEVPASSGKFRSFVRKRVHLPHLASLRRTRLGIVTEEARAVKSLTHRHIAKIIGTYHEGMATNNQFYSLLMYPVGDRDLKAFLDIFGSRGTEQQVVEIEKVVHENGEMWLRSWFKCLASALDYMHRNGVRHQDIKPSNIIHRRCHVFFTDFSSSSRFEVGNTTSTENPARTSQMYAAPEVLRFTEGFTKHGRGTDVFALGAVFCEMLAVLRGHSVGQFHQYLQSDEDEEARGITGIYYGRKMKSIHKFFADDAFYNGSIIQALAGDRYARPDASRLLEDIRTWFPWDQELHCPCEPG